MLFLCVDRLMLTFAYFMILKFDRAFAGIILIDLGS